MTAVEKEVLTQAQALDAKAQERVGPFSDEIRAEVNAVLADRVDGPFEPLEADFFEDAKARLKERMAKG